MSERLGGSIGALASRSYLLLPPIQALIVLAALTYSIGYFLDYSCVVNGWQDPMRYMHLCYTDIPALYAERGFSEGIFPYVQAGSNGEYLEYPVLTGLFMYLAAGFTRLVIGFYPDGFRAFFDVNVILLFIPFVVTVVATALTFKGNPWRAAMIVFAPAVILGVTINWDLIPVALVSLALLTWSRDRIYLTGFFFGLAVAAKFYPIVLLIGFMILAVRTKAWRSTISMLIVAAVTFLAINIPFAVSNFEGWFHFYQFNAARSIDFGSIWYAINQYGLPTIPESILNLGATGLFVVLLIAIAIFVYKTQHSPTIYQVLFLVLAAFTVTNKVYSPQYVLWLIPLAILARPNWRDFLIWQAGELVYFAGIWWFLAGYGIEDVKTLTPQWYATAVFVHVAATGYFAVMVIRDIQINSTESKREVVNRTSVRT